MASRKLCKLFDRSRLAFLKRSNKTENVPDTSVDGIFSSEIKMPSWRVIDTSAFSEERHSSFCKLFDEIRLLVFLYSTTVSCSLWPKYN